MSFALEFRKKNLIDRSKPAEAEPKKRRARAKQRSRMNVSVDTPISARRVAQALLIAGVILAVFNSNALVQYTHSLSDNAFGPRIIVASEKWHALMEAGRMTEISERIRSAVTAARGSSWAEIAGNMGIKAQPLSRSTERGAPSDQGIITSAPGPYDGERDKPARGSIADGSG